MNWNAFLKSLAAHTAVDLVGPIANSWAPRQRPVIFVDGGSKWKQPVESSVVVGDGDSATGPLDFKLSPEKDFSDFAFALRSLPQNIVAVHSYGFLGERRDHELANFGEADAFLRPRLRPTRVHWENAAISCGSGRWELDIQGVFSIFAIGQTRVKIEGECRYRLPQWTELQPLSSFGLSNEGCGRVIVTAEAPFVCCLNWREMELAEPKNSLEPKRK